jgi:RNA polymerase sigma-70 factor (ECF subfamily)
MMTLTMQPLSSKNQLSTVQSGINCDLETLFSLAKEGDRQAMIALCEQTRPLMYRAAYSILRNPHDADDIAQEALVRALKKMRLFKGLGSLEGWLAKIAFNLAKNHIRSRVRKRESTLLDHDDFVQEGLSPEERLETEAQKKRLYACIADLPAKQQEVVKLRLIGQLTFIEISEVLKIKESNAKVHFSQAKQKLVSLLQHKVTP